MSDKERLDYDHASWLVRQRSNVQMTCLLLLKIFREHPEKLVSPVVPDISSVEATILGSLVSCAFSLWRAVFLADMAGKRVQQTIHAEKFLQRLIRDNAIAYPQDRESNEWSFFYYLHNTTYRLNELADLWPELVPAPRKWKGNILGPRPRDQWDIVYERFKKSAETFDGHLHLSPVYRARAKLISELHRPRRKGKKVRKR